MLFTILLILASYQPNTPFQVEVRHGVESSQTTRQVSDEIPFGPDPICGGSKEEDDRWCF